jgi:hypothetical protein
VRHAAKVLKKKDPKQLFLANVDRWQGVRRNSLAERKLSHKAKKRIRYITARRETIPQLPTGTNFIPLLLSCEKWQLVPLSHARESLGFF